MKNTNMILLGVLGFIGYKMYSDKKEADLGIAQERGTSGDPQVQNYLPANIPNPSNFKDIARINAYSNLAGNVMAGSAALVTAFRGGGSIG